MWDVYRQRPWWGIVSSWFSWSPRLTRCRWGGHTWPQFQKAGLENDNFSFWHILAVYRPWFRWTFVMFSLRKGRSCICIGRSVSFRLPRAKNKWKRLIHAPNGWFRTQYPRFFRRASMGALSSCCGTVVNPTDWKMCSRLHRAEGRKWEKSPGGFMRSCGWQTVETVVWRVSWSFKVPKETWLNVYNYLECVYNILMKLWTYSHCVYFALSCWCLIFCWIRWLLVTLHNMIGSSEITRFPWEVIYLNG